MSGTQGRAKKGAKQPFPTFLRLIFPDNLSKYGNMDKIVYKLVYNRKKRLNRQGMALVQIEAYLARKKKYFSTQVYLKPTQWDARRAMVKRHPNADDLNHLMHRQMERMEKTELELRRQGRHVTLDTLKAAVENECSHRSFTAFYRQEIAFRKAEKQIGRELTVLIEGRLSQETEENVYVARTYMDAPGVDGYIYVHAGKREFMTGDMPKVRVTAAREYDLIGELVE